VYLTEDRPDGRLYRFVPDRVGDLAAGTLQVARVLADDTVDWLDVPDPDARTAPTRTQIAESTAFAGGEGIWFRDDRVVFVTKVDQRVWSYDPGSGRLRVLHDALAAADAGMPVLDGPDNVTISSFGDVIVCEDHEGEPELVMISPDGAVAPIFRQTGEARTELAGAAFDPSGTRLYVSSQRARAGGMTYEITGPFRRAEPSSSTTTAVGDDDGAAAGSGGGDDDDSLLPVLGGAAAAVVALGAGVWWLRTRAGRAPAPAADAAPPD
jgi:secreted PhoX family phosphatase